MRFRDEAFACIATMAALALRVPLLTRPMRTDEAATFLYYALQPLSIGLSVYGSPNNHLFHTALMHAAFRLFGPAEWALRLPALIAGVALVPLAFHAARALGTRDGANAPPSRGLIAASLAATWPLLVDYSTDGRGYTLACLFTAIAFMAMTTLRRQGGPFAALLFCLAATLGLWSVPVMFYPFALLTAWGLASPHWRRVLAAASGTVVLTFLVYLPVLIVSGLDALTNNPWVRPLPWPQFFTALPHAALDVWMSWTAAIPLALALLLAALFVAGAIRGRVTLWLALPAVATLLLLQHTIPFPRTWLPLLLLVIVTMSAALPSRFEPVTAIVLGVALAACTVTIPRRVETGELPHVLEVAQFLKVNARPADAIGTLSPSDVPLAFYLHDGRPLRPDVRAPRIWVITNDAIGQVLPKTLYELNIDPRLFTFAKRAAFGEIGIYEFDRR